MLNHLKSHALSYSLAAVVVLFFVAQAVITSLKNEASPFAPQSVEAAIDPASAARFLVLEQKNLELTAENEQLNTQNNQLNAQYDLLNGQNGLLHQANYKLNRENGQLHKANDKLNEENSDLHHASSELQKENQQLQEQIQRLQEIIKEKEDLTENQKRELGRRHQQLADYERAFEAMNAPTKAVKQTVLKKTKTDAGLVALAKETLGVDIEVKACQ